jgi:AraC-like DNA-binding protein
MDNIQDFIANESLVKKIKVDELLFAEFKCPHDEGHSSLWWHNNFFAHILSGKTVLKTPRQEYTLTSGDSFFAKKGSVISENFIHEDFCELLIFMPDDFIKTVIKKYNLPLNTAEPNETGDTIMPLVNDAVLVTYFQSLFTHFHQAEPPTGALLKLKFEELLINILSKNNHLRLKYYFGEVCRSVKPSIKEIMEGNFFSNLSLDEFARLCARSLSSFKKEFSMLYHTTPGKWLHEKRLEYSRFLLETTDHTLDEICAESGFENRSHFNRVFKNKHGLSPARFRVHQRSQEITTS